MLLLCAKNPSKNSEKRHWSAEKRKTFCQTYLLVPSFLSSSSFRNLAPASHPFPHNPLFISPTRLEKREDLELRSFSFVWLVGWVRPGYKRSIEEREK